MHLRPQIIALTLAQIMLCLCLLAPGGSALPTVPQSVKVWRVEQSGTGGKCVIYAADRQIKIESATGGRLIARAPKWDVVLFHPRDRRICTVPFWQWQKKVEDARALENTGQKPVMRSVCGIPGYSYTFKVHALQDADGGMAALYGARIARDFIERRTITIARDRHKLSFEVIEIWRNLMDSPALGSITLEVSEETTRAKRNYLLNTLSQRDMVVDSSFFSVPSGYKNCQAPVSVFLGNEFEDAAKMLVGP
jgi:hypothetical protein